MYKLSKFASGDKHASLFDQITAVKCFEVAAAKKTFLCLSLFFFFRFLNSWNVQECPKVRS